MTKTVKRPAFQSRVDEIVEVEVGLPPSREAFLETEGTAVDLSGLIPLWLLMGPNNSGKTLFARWMAERSEGLFLGALDTTNRTLVRFFDDVEQPATFEQDDIEDFQQRAIDYCASNRIAGLLDTGGGNASVRKMIEAQPGIADDLEGAGAGLVAAYFLSPRQDDLGMLKEFEESGFRPKATVLILNTKDGGYQDFQGIRQNRAFRDAVGRGAMAVYMPRLYPDKLARALEDKGLHFEDAIKGKGNIGIMDRSRVRAFRDQMEKRFEPLRTWFP